MDYPICLNLADRRVLVVGGGEVAFRKASGCLEAGAAVTAVAPEFCARFDAVTQIVRVRRGYADADLEGVFVAMVATDDRVLNRRVHG
ncbi:MAG: bifunctional precorrin-2 dehydrogenase/sirohydrochlorin ferrochelatase, partial [Myxococcales bacterium]